MKLSDHVYFIGVQNPSLRVFDIIMKTDYGTSYNSYLVKGEKTAVIETVHEDYSEEFIRQIEEIVPVSEIDYVILNHTEPDHSGSLSYLMARNPDIEVYGSAAAIKNISAITNESYPSHVVRNGEVLDLGAGVELEFTIAPNLHWPDSMFTYLASEQILFSCDFLGSHYCEPAILDSQVKQPELLRKERKVYFDAIFGPFKKYVLSGLAKIADKPVKTACPSHGPVLHKYLEETIADYKAWSAPAEQEQFLAIFYVSAYGYTKQMAEAFAKEFEAAGQRVKIYNIIENEPDELAAVLNEAAGVLFGSPTINRDALGPVWDLISCTDAIGVNKKPALCFGSYGWSGEACKVLNERLASLKYTVAGAGVTSVFQPSPETFGQIHEAAAAFLELMPEQ